MIIYYRYMEYFVKHTPYEQNCWKSFTFEKWASSFVNLKKKLYVTTSGFPKEKEPQIFLFTSVLLVVSVLTPAF